MQAIRRFLSTLAAKTPGAKRDRRIEEKLAKLDARLQARLDAVDVRLTKIARALKDDRQWRALAKSKLDALLREQYFAEILPEEYPFSLMARRFNLNSQNEEDGMTLALLKEFGSPTHSFVEIGSGTNGGNCGFLAEEFGWRGLMVERHPERTRKCGERFGDPGRVTCLCSAASPENINTLLMENGLTGEVDLFSLDIDSFDYWVFEAMTACSPRIVILEYNGYFGPEIPVTIPRDVSLDDASEGYHGASLAAFVQLAEKKGYRLLACDITGTNAFFARNDLRPDLPAVAPAQAYRRKRDRYDPYGVASRRMIDVVAEAEKRGLPLHYL